MATYIDDRSLQIKQHMTQPRFVQMGEIKAGRRRLRLLQLKDISTYLMLAKCQTGARTIVNLEEFHNILPSRRRPTTKGGWNDYPDLDKVIRKKLFILEDLGLIWINNGPIMGPGGSIVITDLGRKTLTEFAPHKESTYKGLAGHQSQLYFSMMAACECDDYRGRLGRHDGSSTWSPEHVKYALDRLDPTSSTIDETIAFLTGISIGIGLMKPTAWSMY